MGLVEHEQGAVAGGQVHQPAEIGLVAVHGEHGVRDDDGSLRRRRQQAVQGIQVAMGNTVAVARAMRHPSMIDAWLSSSEKIRAPSAPNTDNTDRLAAKPVGKTTARSHPSSRPEPIRARRGPGRDR